MVALLCAAAASAQDTDGSAAALAGPATATQAEGNRGMRLAAYTAGDGVAWSLAGGDAALFTIAGGVLRFVDPPDFEAPADADGDNVYRVTVQSGAGTEAETRAVAVTVTDVDEPGSIAVSALPPKTGTALGATVGDPDGVVGTPAWRWERALGRAGWATIAGAAAASYTPVAADGDRYLRVTATYADAHGAGKVARLEVPHVVVAHRLSALALAGLRGVAGDGRAFYPAFDPDTLHYAARCTPSVTRHARHRGQRDAGVG